MQALDCYQNERWESNQKPFTHQT